MKIITTLRNDPEAKLDLLLNETDNWYRLRLWRCTLSGEVTLKEIGISPDEMLKLVEGVKLCS